MKILVIDGQGGKIGSRLIELIKEKMKNTEITAVGTNSIATAAMLKSGADFGATGENAVKVACRKAQAILGPIGIISADSLLGEVSPEMAVAVGSSDAVKILIPMNRCDTLVAGITELSVGTLIEDAVKKLINLAD